MQVIRFFLIKFVLALALLDISGDFMIVLSENVKEILFPIRILLAICITIVIALGLFDTLNSEIRLLRIFFGFILILTPAFLNGLFFNTPSNAFREIIPFALLLFLPILLRITDDQFLRIINFFVLSLLIIGGIKILASQVISFLIQGGVSWKIILRISPLLIYGYTYYFQRYLEFSTSKGKNILLTMAFLILVLSAQARALNFALLVCTLMLVGLKNFRVSKVLPFVIGVLLAGVLATIITDYEFSQIFGRWQGENYDDAVDYRKEQLDIIKNRFFEQPIVGVGLGYFTPGYRTYDELDNPFLLELDTLNFLSKIGLLLSFLYLSLIFYVLKIRPRKKLELRKLIIFNSSRYTIFGMYLYSTFQTLHSSVLFWIVFSLCLAAILRYSKVYNA